MIIKWMSVLHLGQDLSADGGDLDDRVDVIAEDEPIPFLSLCEIHIPSLVDGRESALLSLKLLLPRKWPLRLQAHPQDGVRGSLRLEYI